MTANSAQYQREYRARNVEKSPEKARARKKRYNQSAKGKETDKASKSRKIVAGRALIALAKSAPCGDCRGVFPACCMDFHHLRDKKFVVGKSIHRGVSVLQREIAKCIVLCANCHRIRHAKPARA